MDKTIAQKMGVKQNARTYFQGTPDNFCEIIQGPPLNVMKHLRENLIIFSFLSFQ